MIFFATLRPHPVSHKDITIINSLELFHQWIEPRQTVCLDKEFNGLNEFYAVPLLTQLGCEGTQFVIDDISFPPASYLLPYVSKLFIGHNVKIDLKIIRLQEVNLRNVYDTMIVEQRLGLDSKRPNDLASVYNRRTTKFMLEKKVGQKSFIGMTEKDLFTTDQIIYSAHDVEVLPIIKVEQARLIAKFNMFKLINEIENPLIPIIADMELEGLNINEEKWKANIESNKLKLINIEKELDSMLVEIGVIKSYKTERQFVEVTQGSLFIDLIEEKTVKTSQKNHINYGSSEQVLEIFDLVDLPRPTETKKDKDKITGVTIYEDKESAGEKALQKFLIEHPNTILQNFIERLIDQREIVKELSSFGEKFLNYRVLKPNSKVFEIGYKNRITNRVHTIFRQVDTATGRLASGESKIGFYNCQQIPALPKYRESFGLSQEEIDNDWWITSCDLSGAETVIMCAFAKDQNLYKWGIEEDDIHSPLATACWRAVYRFRKSKGRSLLVKSLARDKKTGEYPIITLSEDFYITKEHNEPFRRYFKNNTFATVYNAQAAMIGKTLNIPRDEGQVMLNTIKSCIPDTFKMVEEASRFALANGYIIHNTRTNSRKYFAPILRGNPNSNQLTAIEGEARNCRIQGTQADMIKESAIAIDKEFREKAIPNCPLLSIHDEWVWKHKGKENSEIIKRNMEKVGTYYLEGFTVMKAEASVDLTWIK